MVPDGSMWFRGCSGVTLVVCSSSSSVPFVNPLWPHQSDTLPSTVLAWLYSEDVIHVYYTTPGPAPVAFILVPLPNPGEWLQSSSSEGHGR